MRIRCPRLRWLLTAALVAGMSSAFVSPAMAQGKKQDDWFGGWRYEFAVGAFASTVETKIRLDATDLPGTEFSFENDLGIDDNDLSPVARFSYRFGRRSSLSLTNFDLNRSGTSESRISITLPHPDDPDETYVIEADVIVDSMFNAETVVLSYGYSFVNNPAAEFALRFGVHFTDIKLGLATPNQPEIPDTSEAVLAPLPTFGILGGYRFGENWYIAADLGYFALEIDNFDGSITSGTLGVTWQPFKHVAFNMNYQYFEVDVSVTSDEFGGVGGSFIWEYTGPAVDVKVRF
jgi:hypothetical protein